MLVNPQDIPKLLKKHGSLRKIALALEVSNGAVQKSYRKAVSEGIMQHVGMGRIKNQDQKPQSVERTSAPKARKHNGKAYILTSAQNNTLVHDGLFENLEALAANIGAEFFVSTFLYGNRSHWQKNLDKARAGKGEREEAAVWYDPRIVKHINNDRVQIAPGLVWCGEANVSPTAERPLSGFDVLTGRQSMVLPSVKQDMQSVATLGGDGAKFNYCTGTITHRNYIQRKAGHKAEFHHMMGALLVQVDEAGHWWATQINADSKGNFNVYDWRVEEGTVYENCRVEAITFGDIHRDEIDEAVAASTWGKGGMVDVLRPRFQFMHDLLNFARRSHHNIKDPYAMYAMHVQGRESVESELLQIIDWLRNTAYREDCQIVVVDSNHDRHLWGWLRDNDGRRDPINCAFWSRLNAAVVEHIREHGHPPNTILGFALNLLDPQLEEAANVLFLDTDTSFVTCPDEGGGIENALHFDMGNNGSRGALRQFAKMGRRSNGGHSHTAGIDGGAMQAGTKSKMFLGYNHGLSAWSHSDIITHESSKRQIVTFYGPESKWRA